MGAKVAGAREREEERRLVIRTLEGMKVRGMWRAEVRERERIGRERIVREMELRGGALGIEMRASRDRAEVTRVERRRRVQVQVEQLLALERVKRKGIGDQQTLQCRTTVLWASQLGQRTAIWGEEGS